MTVLFFWCQVLSSPDTTSRGSTRLVWLGYSLSDIVRTTFVYGGGGLSIRLGEVTSTCWGLLVCTGSDCEFCPS